jgi:chemotaxis signal transduction protein
MRNLVQVISLAVILAGIPAAAFDLQNSSCIAVANRCENSVIALRVYSICRNSSLTSRAIEHCAYTSAGVTDTQNPGLLDLGDISSTSFLNCIAR